MNLSAEFTPSVIYAGIICLAILVKTTNEPKLVKIMEEESKGLEEEEEAPEETEEEETSNE